MALAWLWPMAWLEVLQGQSPQKPSPSQGFQAKLGPHITKWYKSYLTTLSLRSKLVTLLLHDIIAAATCKYE
jgi:hypothetical protein